MRRRSRGERTAHLPALHILGAGLRLSLLGATILLATGYAATPRTHPVLTVAARASHLAAAGQRADMVSATADAHTSEGKAVRPETYAKSVTTRARTSGLLER